MRREPGQRPRPAATAAERGRGAHPGTVTGRTIRTPCGWSRATGVGRCSAERGRPQAGACGRRLSRSSAEPASAAWCSSISRTADDPVPPAGRHRPRERGRPRVVDASRRSVPGGHCRSARKSAAPAGSVLMIRQARARRRRGRRRRELDHVQRRRRRARRRPAPPPSGRDRGRARRRGRRPSGPATAACAVPPAPTGSAIRAATAASASARRQMPSTSVLSAVQRAVAEQAAGCWRRRPDGGRGPTPDRPQPGPPACPASSPSSRPSAGRWIAPVRAGPPHRSRWRRTSTGQAQRGVGRPVQRRREGVTDRVGPAPRPGGARRYRRAGPAVLRGNPSCS